MGLIEDEIERIDHSYLLDQYVNIKGRFVWDGPFLHEGWFWTLQNIKVNKKGKNGGKERKNQKNYDSQKKSAKKSNLFFGLSEDWTHIDCGETWLTQLNQSNFFEKLSMKHDQDRNNVQCWT